MAQRVWPERLYWAVFGVATTFICLVGALVVYYYATNSKYKSDYYCHAPDGPVGVTRYDPERAYNGYTLFSSSDPAGAFLINMRGSIVHRWQVPFSKVVAFAHEHGEPDKLGWVSSKNIAWRKAYLYPNGDLLVVFVAYGPKLWGRGIAKLDVNSHIIWTYLAHAHHDVEVGPDGRIYGLIDQLQRKPIPQLPELKPGDLEDFVVVLSPDGTLLKKVSIDAAFVNSRYRGVIGMLRDFTIDNPLHTNSVEPMPRSFAKIFPSAGPNTVLLSFRDLDSIALLDLDAKRIVWLHHGPFCRQHDARFLANGDMSVFDDIGDIVHGGHSRALEFTPRPFHIVWQFPGNSHEKLSSQICGAAQKLPNGNFLITESNNARLLEVTPDDKVVWQYRNPLRVGPHKQYTSVLFWARRFAPGDLHFKLKDSGALSSSITGDDK